MYGAYGGGRPGGDMASPCTTELTRYPDPNCNTRDKSRKAIYSIGKNVSEHYYEHGVGESEIRPGNLTTFITFDRGARRSKVQMPRNDTSGHPIPGCFDVSVNELGHTGVDLFSNNIQFYMY